MGDSEQRRCKVEIAYYLKASSLDEVGGQALRNAFPNEDAEFLSSCVNDGEALSKKRANRFAASEKF